MKARSRLYFKRKEIDRAYKELRRRICPVQLDPVKVQDAINSVQRAYVENMINSMPRRYLQIMKASKDEAEK